MSPPALCRLVPLIPLALLVFCPSCSDDPIGPASQVSTDTLIIGEIGPYWPVIVGGDCEFDGHGPLVTLQVRLRVERDSLLCAVYMHAIETQSDWSAAVGAWEETMYRAPIGWQITGVSLDPLDCQVQYIDTDHDYDFNTCGGVVFRSMGDSNGNDICDRTWDDTHVYVRIGTLYVDRRAL